jgi:hypothetical protein
MGSWSCFSRQLVGDGRIKMMEQAYIFLARQLLRWASHGMEQ